MLRRLMTWIRENHGVVSITGGLVIFFSWTATNTLVQRYNRLKASAETAEETFRLYTTLHGLRDQLNSVSMELVQARGGAGRSRSGDPGMEAIRTKFALARLDARQVQEMSDFAFETAAYSNAIGSPTPASAEISGLATAVDRVLQRLGDLEGEVEAGRSGPKDRLRGAVGAFDRYVRTEAISRVKHLYPKIVDASNRRREEGRAELARAKRRAAIASRAALFLYVLGSFMALTGQYIDKVKSRQKKTTLAAPVTT